MELRPMERRFVEAIWDGKSQKEAAMEMGMTPPDAHHLVRRMKKRAGLPSTIALLRRLVREGVLQA